LQAQAHFPVPRVQIPPPEESTFVVAAREALPATRITSAQNRGGLTARGRTNVETDRGRGRGNELEEVEEMELEEAEGEGVMQLHHKLQEEGVKDPK
jgi:hypothetical protein